MKYFFDTEPNAMWSFVKLSLSSYTGPIAYLICLTPYIYWNNSLGFFMLWENSFFRLFLSLALISFLCNYIYVAWSCITYSLFFFSTFLLRLIKSFIFLVIQSAITFSSFLLEETIFFAEFLPSSISSQQSRFRASPSFWGRLNWNLVGMFVGSERLIRFSLFFVFFKGLNSVKSQTTPKSIFRAADLPHNMRVSNL